MNGDPIRKFTVVVTNVHGERFEYQTQSLSYNDARDDGRWEYEHDGGRREDIADVSVKRVMPVAQVMWGLGAVQSAR